VGLNVVSINSEDREGIGVLLIALGAACSDSRGNGSRLTGREEPVAPPPAAFQPLSRAGMVYDGDPGIYDMSGARDYHGGVLSTRLVLYEDSTFALQGASPRHGFFEFRALSARSLYDPAGIRWLEFVGRRTRGMARDRL
jgi:hypothetical protein